MSEAPQTTTHRQEAPPTTQRTPAEIKARREEALKKLQQKASQRQHVPTEQSRDSNADFNHDGTLKPFRPPAQTGFKGIEKEKWKSSSGREFTSLKKLNEAGQKMASKKN